MSSGRFCVRCGGQTAALDAAGRCPSCAEPAPAGPYPAPTSRVVSQAPESRTFPTETSVPLEWQPGDRLVDLYEVRGTLGAGAMGTVYRVHHLGWGVDLAVKCPRPSFLDRAHGPELFVAEATAWVDLGLHPHVVACHYVRTLGGVPRVFAELVEGGSLQDWVADGRLYAGDERTALLRMLDVSTQVIWGLAHAHQAGLVHQDVKPANVLLTPEATAKVTDFGLSTVGSSGGTPAYFSPQQADAVRQAGAGIPADQRTAVTPSSDVWSWALVVLDLFDGQPEPRRPGQAAAHVLASVRDHGPTRPGVPALPGPLQGLLARCFLEQPEQRPDVEAVSDEIVALYADVAGSPYPRRRLRAADLRADSLTNKAVSLLDLGHEAEAKAAWSEALAADAHHLEAGYDVELWQWRHGVQPDDLELVTRLGELERRHAHSTRGPLLLAGVHVERGDPEAALDCLDGGTRGAARADRDVQRTRGIALKMRRPCLWSRAMDGGTSHALALLTGDAVVAAHDDGQVRVWDAAGRCIEVLSGHDAAVYAVDVSPDGRLVASTGLDGTVRVWRLGTAEPPVVLEIGDPQYAVSWSPDGARVACGGYDHRVRIFDAATGRQVGRFDGHRNHVTSVCWHPSGATVVTAGFDSTIRVWGLDGTSLATLDGHRGQIHTLVLSRDGSQAVTGSGMALQFTGDETVRVWDLARGSCLRVLSGHVEAVTAVALMSPGQVASGSVDGTVRLWDLTTGQCRRTVHVGGRGVSALTCLDEGTLVVATTDGHLQRWDLRDVGSVRAPWALCRPTEVQQALETAAVVTQARRRAERALAQGRVAEALESVRAVRATPGYERDRDLLELWHQIGSHAARPSGLRGAYRRDEVEAHPQGVGALALTPDGRTAVTVATDVGASSGRCLEVWDLDTASMRLTIDCTSGGRAAVVTPDGGRLLVGCGDHAVREWDVSTGALLRTLTGHSSDVLALAVSPDGRRLASGSAATFGVGSGMLLVWDLDTGTVLRRLDGHTQAVRCLTFSADGSRLLSGALDRTLRLWHLGTGDCRVYQGHRKAVTALALAPDQQTAWSASDDASVRRWDLRTGKAAAVLRGHKLGVTALALTPDGEFAFTGGTDATVRAWSQWAIRPLATIVGHRGEVTGVAVTPDARRLVSVSMDRTLRTWDLDWDYSVGGTPPVGQPGEEQP